MRAEWKPAEDFAPFAEKLGVTTDSVMAAQTEDGGFFWCVFYTEKPTVESDVWIAVFWKGNDGELELLRCEFFRTADQFLAEVRERGLEVMH